MAFAQQPLIPTEYKMKLIQDLGQVPSKSNPNRSYRHAIFECPKCKQHFEARAVGAKARTQESCVNCIGDHNLSKDPLYAIWNGIRQRCYNPKRKDFPRYGGVGITMCPEWKDSPESFILWCKSNGWSPNLVIDKDIKSKALGLSTPVYSPETLSFITQQDNAKAANAKQVIQYTLDNTYIATFDSCVDAALSLSKPYTAKSAIANCCRGINHTAYGFIWKYSE